MFLIDRLQLTLVMASLNGSAIRLASRWRWSKILRMEMRDRGGGGGLMS
jgi:hypothetical protein